MKGAPSSVSMRLLEVTSIGGKVERKGSLCLSSISMVMALMLWMLCCCPPLLTSQPRLFQSGLNTIEHRQLSSNLPSSQHQIVLVEVSSSVNQATVKFSAFPVSRKLCLDYRTCVMKANLINDILVGICIYLNRYI